MHEMSPNCWPFALRFLSSMFTLALGPGGKARIRELSEPNMLPTLHYFHILIMVFLPF